jgi:uncharacterized protein (TIGR02611 family)
MADMRGIAQWVMRSGKRIAVTVLGFGLVIGGIALLVLPGPGLLVVLAGLAVLATEYAWARHALDETKRRARGAKNRFLRRNNTGE